MKKTLLIFLMLLIVNSIFAKSDCANISYASSNGRIISISAEPIIGDTTFSDSSENAATAVVTTDPLPTASIFGSATICSGNTAVIHFSGTPNATVTYTVNGGANQFIVLGSSGNASLTTPVLTADSIYSLVSVASSGTPSYSQAQTGSAVVTVSALPTATISGTTSICLGTTAVITFTGTPGAVVTYTVDNGPNGTIALGLSGVAILTTPILTNDSVYKLVSVTAPTTGCSKSLSGSATITVNPLPTVTVNSLTVCQGGPATVTATAGTIGSYTYLWSVPVGMPNPGNVASFQTTIAGVYTVLVTNVSTGCSSYSASGTVDINPLPTVAVNSLTVCQGGPATVTATPGTAGAYSYSWTTPAGVPIPGNVASFQTTAAGVYTVTIANNVTGCTSLSASGTITHMLAPVIIQPTDYIICDEDNDGVSCLFDLHSKDAEISTAPGTVITYYRSLADSQSGKNPITANPFCNNQSPFNQTIYIRVEDPAAPSCASYTTLNLIVNPTPSVPVSTADYQLCDVNNPGDGVELFSLSIRNAEIINGQPGMSVSYYLTQADARSQSNPLQNSYTNAFSPQTIWYAIKNTITGCANYGSFRLVVNSTPIVNSIPDYEACDENSDGFAVFDLSKPELLTSIVGSNQSSANLNISFYLTMQDANVMVSPLPQNYVNAMPGTQVVYFRIVNIVTGCFAIGSLKLVVKPCVSTPDDNFEQVLIDLGYDTALDGKVDTSAIDGIETLNLSGKNIGDLSGIEYFKVLRTLNCSNNNLTSLDFGSSSNSKSLNSKAVPTLQTLNCSHNQLTYLDISGLTSLQNLDATSNPNLSCITVSDVAAADAKTTWMKDDTALYSTSCSKLAVDTHPIVDFRATVYPNPFNNSFVIDVNTLSQEPLKIKVYDMLGKLIEQIEVNPNTLATRRIGQNYSAGIYNIIVTQESEMKTLRVIKK